MVCTFGRSKFDVIVGGETKMALSLTNRFVNWFGTNFKNSLIQMDQHFSPSEREEPIRSAICKTTKTRKFVQRISNGKNCEKHLNEAIVGDNYKCCC